jgi:hypothetical protein
LKTPIQERARTVIVAQPLGVATLQRILDFLTDHLEYSEKSASNAKYLRNFSKWLLEVIRNLVVVGFVTLLAQKSNGWTLTVLAWIAGFAVWATIYTYIDPIQPKVVSYKRRWVSILLFVGFGVLIYALIMSVSLSLNYTVIEIVKSQAPK